MQYIQSKRNTVAFTLKIHEYVKTLYIYVPFIDLIKGAWYNEYKDASCENSTSCFPLTAQAVFVS